MPLNDTQIPTTNWSQVGELLLPPSAQPDPHIITGSESDVPGFSNSEPVWDYKCLEPDNPLYPLPKDYLSLTKDGQKQARVAAVCRQRTPMELVAAWDTFRRLYLLTTPPGFFYHKWAPSPPFHYEMIRDVGEFGRNLFAAPRGFAKSIVIGTELPLFLLLTREYFRIAMCLATDKMVEDRFDVIMQQLTENEAIIEDFGEQKPGKGRSKVWNKHLIKLANGSKMQGLSVTGRKRGTRPDMFILDDPEYDDNPNADVAGTVTREKFETMLFKAVIPMLEKGSSIVWIGTIVGERSFLSHAVSGEDERFKYWNTKVFDAGDPDDPNSAVLWAEKWDQETLRIRKNEIGEEAYDNEYRNRVGAGKLFTFTLDDRKNFYDVNVKDEVYKDSPLLSNTAVSWYEPDPLTPFRWVRKSEEARIFFSKMFILLTVDVADTVSRHSDYSCVAVSGFDRSNTLWLLDMWLGKVSTPMLLEHIYRLGWKWRVRVVGIESVSEQIEVFQSADTLLQERQISGWKPRVMPIDYSGMRDRKKKGQRIRTLGWRFPRGKIKLPWGLRTQWPWSELINQILKFTEDLRFLSHDDAIDTVAMNHYVVHGKGAEDIPPEQMESMAQRIAAGKLWAVPGVPWLSGMTPSDFSKEILDAFVQRAYSTGTKQEQTRKPRFHVSPVGRGRRQRYDGLHRDRGPVGSSTPAPVGPKPFPGETDFQTRQGGNDSAGAGGSTGPIGDLGTPAYPGGPQGYGGRSGQ